MITEKLYCIKEVGGILNLSDDMVRRIFRSEPGVLDFSFADPAAKSTGRNKLLRIPESVLWRVCQRRTRP